MQTVLSLILGGGRGSRLYPLTMLRSKPAVTAPLVGANKISQIDDAVASLEMELAPGELAALERPYTPRHDFQGISDEAEMQKIRDSIPGYASA